MAPSSCTTARQLATPGAKRRGDRHLLGAPGESEDVGRRDSRRISNAAAARPTLANAAGPSSDSTSMPWPGDDRLGQTEALLEFALLVGVQVVAQVRRHHHVDADQPVGLGPGDEAAGRRPRDTQTLPAISAWVSPSR